MKVSQFINDKGNPVRNQFRIHDEKTGDRFFQSYDSIIVKIDKKGKVTLGKDWNYSATTSKYRSQFLGETTKETQAKLDAGVYKLDENL